MLPLVSRYLERIERNEAALIGAASRSLETTGTLSQYSNQQQARSVATSMREVHDSVPGKHQQIGRGTRRTLRRARRAWAPRPALRVPGARSEASTTDRIPTHTARSST